VGIPGIFLPLGVIIVNGIMNGLNYRNKSYFFISFLLYLIFGLILVYDLKLFNSQDIWLVLFLFASIFSCWVYEYKMKEKEINKPWKNEW